MIAKRSDCANIGPARRISSFARQAARGISAGEPAIESVRAGTERTALWTKYARSCVTGPRSRYWIAFDGPTQYGLPSLHSSAERASGVPASGTSSGSGCAGRHAVQRPAVDRVRKSTLPGPRQCRPMRSNAGGRALASVRTPSPSGTSCVTSRASSASAEAGNARAMTIAVRSFTKRMPRVTDPPFGVHEDDTSV
jgi:hypothetical protein